MSLGKETTAFGELYSAYAAGCLDPAFALLVETQAALRNDIAEAVHRGEVIAAAMLEAEPPAAMRNDAVERALAAIEELDVDEGLNGHAADVASGGLTEIVDLPSPLRDRVIDTMERQSWQFTTPGIRRLTLETGGDAETELYRLEPGVTVPRHTHAGSEFTLVVTGRFADETGSYGPGDLSVKGPEHVHRPVADMGEVCYALSVRDGGLKFTGVIGAVQRILGG
ncbi:MAG: ChrR family anti-sigma-E factor [Pseudomonadota bacterium]